MIQQFNVGVAGRQVNGAGNFFRYESAGNEGADQSLRVRADGNDLGFYLPGDAIELPNGCQTWDLTPAQCSAVVKVGFGRITTVRSTVVGSIAVSSIPAQQMPTPASTSKTVTNGSGTLVAANAARTYLMIQNKDANGFIWINIAGATATQANGIRIAPGGFWEWDYRIPVGLITAIGDIASNANVVVVEG